jgi:hypothetical protein
VRSDASEKKGSGDIQIGGNGGLVMVVTCEENGCRTNLPSASPMATTSSAGDCSTAIGAESQPAKRKKDDAGDIYKQNRGCDMWEKKGL